MNNIFTCWRSTKVPILSLSLAVLACVPLTRQAIAAAVSAPPRQPSINTKIISADRPLGSPTVAKTPKSFLSIAANLPPANTLQAQGTATARSLEITEIRGTVTFKGISAVVGDRLLAPGDEIITGPDSTARLAIDNNTGIVEVAEQTAVDTIEGSVAVSGRPDSEVIVNRGNSTIVFPQTGPVDPAASPAQAALKVHTLSRLSGNIYRFSGQIDPTDILYINQQAIKIDRLGKFNIQGILPPSRRLKIVVRGPSVRERHYEFAVP